MRASTRALSAVRFGGVRLVFSVFVLNCGGSQNSCAFFRVRAKVPFLPFPTEGVDLLHAFAGVNSPSLQRRRRSLSL